MKTLRALGLTLVLLTGACASDSPSRYDDLPETVAVVGIAVGLGLLGWSVLP